MEALGPGRHSMAEGQFFLNTLPVTPLAWSDRDILPARLPQRMQRVLEEAWESRAEDLPIQ